MQRLPRDIVEANEVASEAAGALVAVVGWRDLPPEEHDACLEGHCRHDRARP
eukprot:CAMPEP_0119371866 /NCGR_PEP_ID=MMETSP1334-20130426/17956_1 /TAXON_ID=127549 /ORGANISM="Calcidiscus leptoporus, Strain RCC1130" /LENGTH=51 /DNA_ID=CAMNT_0007389227 /DNA_START=59 /DNA_END=210 /DNA_ORIENTATION=+